MAITVQIWSDCLQAARIYPRRNVELESTHGSEAETQIIVPDSPSLAVLGASDWLRHTSLKINEIQ